MSDSWRLRIRHRTGFSYAAEVESSYNEARMTPCAEPRQSVLASRIEVRPTATTHRYVDYWGTTVTSFDVHVPHDTLVVTADSTVETTAEAPIPAGGEVSWEGLAVPEVTDRWHELLLATGRTALDDELVTLAASAREREPGPDQFARAVCALVHEEVRYDSEVTGVASDAVHAWQQRAGVCQDISHLAVGLMRQAGVPARYVSGYLHPEPDAPIGRQVVGESHAWVEWWSGQWCGWDPTNGVPIGVRHVVVGRGRDYGDVPPLKGVFSGGGDSDQQVAVEITRLR